MSHFMRIILSYDLAMQEYEDKKAYTKFRKELLRRGYIMIQYSLYMKCINASTKLDYEIKAVQKFLPIHGNVRIFTVTEKQYHSGPILIGRRNKNELVNTNERYIKIDENL